MNTKILLSEDQIPRQWYNIIPDMPGPLAPVINPQTLKPVTPEDMLAIFPMSLIEQEMSPNRWIDIPDEVREIYKLWRPSPLLPRPSPGKGPRNTGQDLLQVRRGLPGRLPQTELGHPPGLLQQTGRHPPSGNRDRRRSVGQFPGPGLFHVRPGMHGLHGQGLLHPETVPQEHDAAVGRNRASPPRPNSPIPAARSWPMTRIATAAWVSPSPKRWRMPPPMPTPTTPWAACSTMSACTRRSSARRHRHR